MHELLDILICVLCSSTFVHNVFFSKRQIQIYDLSLNYTFASSVLSLAPVLKLELDFPAPLLLVEGLRGKREEGGGEGEERGWVLK